MKVKFFKNSRTAALDDVIGAFIREDPRRVLRDVRVAYGVSTDAGMIDDAIVVAVLYDEIDTDAPRSPWDAHDAQQLQRMDRTRDEMVRARA